MVLIGALSAALQGEATAVAWDKIIDAKIDKLNKEQKSRVEQNLKRIANTRGCQGTLARCLTQGDLTARRHAGYVVRMVRKGKDDQFIDQGIAHRHASAHTDELLDIDVSDHPHFGNTKAKVVLVEYACFQCPYCSYLAPKLKKLKKRFVGKVVHYYKFFPVRSHPYGVNTALAAVAAHRQGRFWELYTKMYANLADLAAEDVRKYVEQVGLDLTQYKKDVKDPALMSYVERDKLEGMRLGVEGTPTFFVNGKLYQGANDYREIADRIAEEIDIIEGRIP